MLLVHAEDYGWGYNTYLNGDEIDSFYLDYDAPTDNTWVEGKLRDFAGVITSYSIHYTKLYEI